MDKKSLDELLLNLIIDTGLEGISLVGPWRKEKLIETLEAFGYDLDIVDIHPDSGNPRDAVFDDIEYKELIVVCNAEKMYPLGKVTKGTFIIVGDNNQHNGDCNPIDSCEKLIEQNNLKATKSLEHGRWFIVVGDNYDSNI